MTGTAKAAAMVTGMALERRRLPFFFLVAIIATFHRYQRKYHLLAYS